MSLLSNLQLENCGQLREHEVGSTADVATKINGKENFPVYTYQLN